MEVRFSWCFALNTIFCSPVHLHFSQLKFKLLEGKGDGPLVYFYPLRLHWCPSEILDISGVEST